MKKRDITIVALLIAAAFAFGFGKPAATRTAVAAAPAVSLVSLDPLNTGGDLVYLTCAPVTSKASSEALLSVLIEIKNNEGKDIYLDKISIECKGNGNNISRTFQPDADGKDTIRKDKSYEWQNSRDYHELGDVIKLKSPFPNQVVIKFFFDGYSDPFVISKNLKGYLNNAPGNAYDFPAKDENLLMNEYWYADAGHGGGGQVFAYDMVVAGWDEDTKKWGQKKQGKTEDKNESYRCYGKKIYSAGDGEVLGYINDWKEAPSTSDTGTAGGNSIKINNGKETLCYYHMQKGSINKNLLKAGAKIKKGDFIGLVGNSGNSSGPHLHIHAIWDPDKDGKGPFIPLQFSNMYAIDIKALSAPDPNGDWVKLNKTGLPYIVEEAGGGNGRALLWPDSRKPCWYPYNLREIARHAIPESQYQEEAGKIWSCGYYPVWVDAYAVNGKTYFNTIFRYNKEGFDVVVRHDMSAEKYQQEYDTWIKKGYRLQQIDNYNDAGKLKIAAIFIKKGGKAFSQPAYHAQSAEQHQKLFDKYTGEDYVPVNVSVVVVGGKKYYSAFYEKRNVGGALLKSGLTQEEYQDMFDEMNKKKWEQVYINAYEENGKTRFSVIWYAKAGYDAWSATRKSGKDSYQEKWEDHLSDGYLTRCVTGYEEGGRHWFAAHWSK
jgi:hypothetical protein